jgi:hypothetical protein
MERNQENPTIENVDSNNLSNNTMSSLALEESPKKGLKKVSSH